MHTEADVIFVGGRIYTAQAGRPWVQAVATKQGLILDMGDSLDVLEWRGDNTEIVELGDGILLPAFTESHIHFVELALRASQVDATGATTAFAVVDRVRTLQKNLAADSWIRGGGWDANSWEEGQPPHRKMLDEAMPDLPVALDSKDLHSVWVNSAALRIAGIDASTGDIPGGIVERDADGNPTGVLRDRAVELVSRFYAQPDFDATLGAVREAIPSMHADGLVAIHNANDTSGGLALRIFQELRRDRSLRLRVLQHLPVTSLDHAIALGLRSGLGDEWLRIGGVKMFADGALGSRTAHMLKPYLGSLDNIGVAASEKPQMLAQALDASAAGLSLAIHAIGDRANRDVVDILAAVRREETWRSGSNTPALRHRIEHVQCLHPDDLARLAELDVIASVQPVHATSDMVMLDRNWGEERAKASYAFRSLLDSGIHVVFGSDGPIEPHAPLVGLHAAVTRRRADGQPGSDGWHGEQRINVSEAVDAYTKWPAYAAGELEYRGTIAPGKVADLVVLSRDIFSIDPMEILETKVTMTMLKGEVVWRMP